MVRQLDAIYYTLPVKSFILRDHCLLQNMRGTNTTLSDIMEELDAVYDFAALKTFVLNDIQIYSLPGDLGNRTAEFVRDLESGAGVKMTLQDAISGVVSVDIQRSAAIGTFWNITLSYTS